MIKYHDILKEEARKYGWGLILIQRDALKKVIMEVLTKRRPIRLLDIGCWSCLLKGWLEENFGSNVIYVGVDVLDVPNRLPNTEFHIMSGESLLFPAESFDVVTYIESLEHIFDYVRSLREAYRVLRKDGVVFIQSVICTDPNALHDRTHYHVLHPVTLSRLLQWIGFKNISHIEHPNFCIWGWK